MIGKINQLKSKTKLSAVVALCENAISGLSSAMYKSIPVEAQQEIEKVQVKNLFEGLAKVNDPEVQAWLSNQKRSWAVNHLGVRESIQELLKSEGLEDQGLKETLLFYRDHLENGVPEVKLYESYLTAMQAFNYFPRIGNAIKDIQDNVKNYKSDIDLKKIVETMKESKSRYLVEYIEDVLQNYLENKNEQTKHLLKESLMKWSYDPFIRDIINLVTLDATELQLEHANATCDIEKIYSPIIYLGENEAVFGVRGLFYVKKGNIVSRIGEKEVARLDKDFVQLCEAINSPNVVINGKSVTIYEGKDKAVVTSDKVYLNEMEMGSKEFAESANIAHWTGKGTILGLVETFRKNFDEIAEIDFAKRVFLKEDLNHAADVFKLRGNIFIATHNTTDGKSTFYRNVNPIQAKGIMMEHLRYDVSRLFEGLLPEQEKILDEIAETKKEYTDYIATLESKIAQFKGEYATPTVVKVLEALDEELTEVKNDYKDYLNVAEKYVRPLGEAITITVDVDGKKFTVPIPADGGQAGNPEEAGTEVGKDDMEKEPASAVTFDDDKTEMLGDTPTISTDSVSMGADQVGAEADKAEAEKEIAGGEEAGNGEGEGEGEGENADGSAAPDLEGGEDDEIKIGDESDQDQPEDVNTEEEPGKDPDEEEEKPKDEATDAKTEVDPELEAPKKRRVFLKKKKTIN
jgi:hypothetical protein